ncbi:MAG TPA: thiamine pyrophosphate-dependent enzyme [Caulobacteraceae bacterium]
MTVMTGGDALTAGLVDHGIDTVFGLPGAQIYGLFDALQREPSIRVIGARHEQTCGYMAFGYSRSTGRPAAFSVVPGPGLLNAGAAMLTAFGCNTPALLLTGQVPTDFLGRGRGHLHEMPDQLATLRTFVKWADRVETPATARAQVARAFQEMTSGRPGPAALEMPWDVFTQKAEIAPPPPLGVSPPPPVDADQIDRAARLIKASRRPMIFVGAGAFEAAAPILALAEEIDAPVVGFRSGRGIVGNDHELGLTLADAYNLWPQTDLMIGIGTRLELPTWRWPWRPAGQTCIRIDIDPAEMRRYRPDVGVVADADPATSALVEAVRKHGFSRTAGRREEIREAKVKALADIQAVQPQLSYLNVLREVLPRDGFVTDELSQVGFASWYGFPVYEPRTYITSGYQGTLGSGFPTALGIKVANPDKPVVAITGDGGFMFAAQELATAVQYGIDVVTLVFNNNAFGNVRRDQTISFEGRVIGAELVNPDFVKFAESFGVRAARVNTPAAFGRELQRALTEGGPQLIEIEGDGTPEASPWRFIHPPKPEGVG